MTIAEMLRATRGMIRRRGCGSVPLTFAAPLGGGAGGTFAGDLATVAVTTNRDGIAIAPPFTANGTAGTYAVTATIANPARGNFQAYFDLDNQQPG
jgi:hypothetical protein